MSEKTNEPIYTHDEAARIVDLFESVLAEYGITVPSPEDDEREPDNEAKLYGTTYSNLLDDVESHLIEILNRHANDSEVLSEVISYVFSGKF